MRIGFLVHDIDGEYSYSLFEGISRFCDEKKSDLFVFNIGTPMGKERSLNHKDWTLSRFINEANVDGFIVPSTTMFHGLEKFEIYNLFRQISSLPIVSIGCEIPGIPSIVLNQKKGYKSIIEHLIDVHKCNKFAFLTPKKRNDDIEERFTIFKDVLNEHNIVFDENRFFEGDYTMISARNVLSSIKSKDDVDFNCIVCTTDELALGAMEHFYQLGVSIPHELIVVGFDDTKKSQYSEPTLTTVNQSKKSQGYLAAEMLFSMHKLKSVKPVHVMDTEGRRRQSCGCIRLNDYNTLSLDDRGKVVQSKENVDTSLKYLMLQSELYYLQYFLEARQANHNLIQYAALLNESLARIKIKRIIICLYKSAQKPDEHANYELPKEAYIYFAKDEDKNLLCMNRQEYFDCSKKLVSDDFSCFLSGKILVFNLEYSRIQYGYMMFEITDVEPIIYRLFCAILSKQISHSYEVGIKQEEKHELDRRNKELMKTGVSLMNLSRTDELTGILNRRGFMSAAQQEIYLATDIGKTGLVIYGDIDGLKEINDRYGHDAGDRAIIAEAEILTKTFRSADTIGRLGGDEFAILSISLSEETFGLLKEKLEANCAEWNRNTKEPFSLSISLGAARFDDEDFDLSSLLRKADVEQYKEKRRHKEERGKL